MSATPQRLLLASLPSTFSSSLSTPGLLSYLMPNDHYGSGYKDMLFDDDDDLELKEFFFGLHRFEASPENVSDHSSSESSSASGSESSSSPPQTPISPTHSLEEDQIHSIFALDKESYDFESKLPPSTAANIQELLDEPDVYDTRFSGENYKELNPLAQAFVPSSRVFLSSTAFISNDISVRPTRPSLSPLIRARVLTASSSNTHRLSTPQKPVAAPWRRILRSALTASSPSSPALLAEHARNLAHSNLWHASALAELAQELTWKAFAAGSNVDQRTLAPFAQEINRALCEAFDEETANSFVWHLRESVIGTFKACWCASESPKAISYRFTPSEAYVLSATSLTAFIGDLFTFDLVRVQHIKMCLNILVHELNSLEHLTAISVLVEHAGFMFWCFPGGVNTPHASRTHANSILPVPLAPTGEPDPQMIHLFLRNFLPKTVPLQNRSSVLAKNVLPGHGEKDTRLQEIMEILAQWCVDLRVRE